MGVATLHSILISEMHQPKTRLTSLQFKISAYEKVTVRLRPLSTQFREIKQLKRQDTIAAGKVLVSISLQGKSTLPTLAEFEKYLTYNIPPTVADIKIEATFPDLSQVLLLTLPIEIRDLLGEEYFPFCQPFDRQNPTSGSRDPEAPISPKVLSKRHPFPIERRKEDLCSGRHATSIARQLDSDP